MEHELRVDVPRSFAGAVLPEAEAAIRKGTIPSTISNLVTLNELNMSYNFGVVGFLPREVGSMANLTVLHIYSAGIHGPIPDSLSLLGSLEELWLNGNRLSGIIPEGLGRLSHLRELYLNANELVGEIPCSFSELASLEGLNLSWNRLSGNFPACLSSMVRTVLPRKCSYPSQARLCPRNQTLWQ
ncbi:Hypothetical leucine rich repeat protein [Ectocarpus siliculosus]|uniref:Hypothetical leucine rich repeat protein n=1 Tax=Ectocarpus siliculosus TaxID=2880 RepID=D7G175_ECTSI|nr:Hypothetical leucine rich repeat protein [Ectocarpus siliculosus]|eukprot:CBJ33185.1 Hypothetical leucine rich repeat protein [Ectocarpus siliculosus]